MNANEDCRSKCIMEYALFSAKQLDSKFSIDRYRIKKEYWRIVTAATEFRKTIFKGIEGLVERIFRGDRNSPLARPMRGHLSSRRNRHPVVEYVVQLCGSICVHVRCNIRIQCIQHQYTLLFRVPLQICKYFVKCISN